MSDNKTTLANHNDRLEALVEQVNALPDAGGGEVAEPVVQPLSVTKNGTYTPPEGVDGYAPVNVSVPIPTPVLKTLRVTKNGTYNAPSGTDGYNKVEVNVPSSGGIGGGNVNVSVLIEVESGVTAHVFYMDGAGYPSYSPITESFELTNTADVIVIYGEGCSGHGVAGDATTLLDTGADWMYVFGFTPESKYAIISFDA